MNGLVWTKEIRTNDTQYSPTLLDDIVSDRADCCRDVLADKETSPLWQETPTITSGTRVRCDAGHVLTLSDTGFWEVT